MTAADYLTEGLHLPPLDISIHDIDLQTCRQSGALITQGYPISEVTTDATNEFLDTFHGSGDGYVSDAVARCFKGSNPRAGMAINGSHLVIGQPGSLTAYRPLINAESADAQGRPCWSRLVREIYPSRSGEPVVCLLITDTKIRRWPGAVIGYLGDHTPVMMHDSESAISGLLYVDWSRLLVCLDLVESIYTAGFAKQAIRQGLMLGKWSTVEAVGIEQTIRFETRLQAYRCAPEFPLALLIAQKATPTPCPTP